MYYNQLLYTKTKQFKQLRIGMTFQVSGSATTYMRTNERQNGDNAYIVQEGAPKYARFEDSQEVYTL